MALVLCLAVCEFDVEYGQKIVQSHPASALEPELARKVACLALPDSPSNALLQDLVYCFRLRSDALPLSAASATDHRYLFGCSYFRQQRDPSVRRGFLQRSLVAISETPHVALLKQVVRILGRQFFDADGTPPASSGHASLLEAAFADMHLWPPAVPGRQLELPLCGMTLHFDVPWTTLASYRAPPSRARLTAAATAASQDAAANDFSLRAPQPPPPAGGSVTLSDVFTPVARHNAPTGPGDDAAAAAAPSTAAALQVTPRGGGAGAPPPPTVTAGLFTDVGLFTVFRGLVPALWHLWELAITGQPVLVMGANPAACGDAVLGLVSLVSPLEFSADFRPYFTLYDPDFHQVTALVDAQWGRTNTRLPKLPGASASSAAAGGGGARLSRDELAAQTRALAAQPTPPLLIGTTNPFFTKALERWPNAIWLGHGGGVGGGGGLAGGSNSSGGGALAGGSSRHGSSASLRAWSAGPGSAHGSDSGRGLRAGSLVASSSAGGLRDAGDTGAGTGLITPRAAAAAAAAADAGAAVTASGHQPLSWDAPAPATPERTPRLGLDVSVSPAAASRQPQPQPQQRQPHVADGQRLEAGPSSNAQHFPAERVGDGGAQAVADARVAAASSSLRALPPTAAASSGASSTKDDGAVGDNEGLPSAHETPGINLRRESAHALVALAAATSSSAASRAAQHHAPAHRNHHRSGGVAGVGAVPATTGDAAVTAASAPPPPLTPASSGARAAGGIAPATPAGPPSTPSANMSRPLRGYSTSEVRYRIIATTASLGDALPGLGGLPLGGGGGDDANGSSEACLVVRQPSLIAADRSLLRSLLRVRAGDEDGQQGAGSWGSVQRRSRGPHGGLHHGGGGGRALASTRRQQSFFSDADASVTVTPGVRSPVAHANVRTAAGDAPGGAGLSASPSTVSLSSLVASAATAGGGIGSGGGSAPLPASASLRDAAAADSGAHSSLGSPFPAPSSPLMARNASGGGWGDASAAAGSSAGGGGGGGGGGASTGTGAIPAVLLNNSILRAHFRALTLAFLAPFERYFQLAVQRPATRPGAGGGSSSGSTPASSAASTAGGGGGGGAGRGPMGGGQLIPGGASSSSSLSLSSSSSSSSSSSGVSRRSSPTPPADASSPEASSMAASTGAGSAHPPLHMHSGGRPGSAMSSSSSLLAGGAFSPAAADRGAAAGGGAASGGAPLAAAGAAAAATGSSGGAARSAASARGSLGGGGGSYGPYDDLVGSFLPRFELAAFLAELEASGGPRHPVLAQGAWRALYERFCGSPHFYPWYHARRREAARELFAMSRALRLSMTVAELLAPARLASVFAAPGALQAIEAAAAARAVALRDEVEDEAEEDEELAVVLEYGGGASRGGLPPAAAVAAAATGVRATSGPSSPQPDDADRGGGWGGGGAQASMLRTSSSSITSSPLQQPALLGGDASWSGSSLPSHHHHRDVPPPSAVLLPGDTGTLGHMELTASGLLQGASHGGSAFSPSSSKPQAVAPSTGSTSVAPVSNPGPLTRVIGRGMPHALALTGGLGAGGAGGAGRLVVASTTPATLVPAVAAAGGAGSGASTTPAGGAAAAFDQQQHSAAALVAPVVSSPPPLPVSDPDAGAAANSRAAAGGLAPHPQQQQQPGEDAPVARLSQSRGAPVSSPSLPGGGTASASTSPPTLPPAAPGGNGGPSPQPQPPLRARLPVFTRDDLAVHEGVCVELHAKIVAAFARDAAFLAGDRQLRSAMKAHLEAVKAVMPPHLLRAVARHGEDQLG